MAFNKMFVMLPVMFAARKIDGEDPQVVYYLRLAYGVVQLGCILVVIYTYIKASKISQESQGRNIVYVPPPATPFADPNAKKKYTEVPFGAHVLTTARSLLGSTLFGVILTVGLHMYKGMVVGLAIQAIMGPINLMENKLVYAIVTGSGSVQQQDKIFEEKTAAELTDDDEVVDGAGNPVGRQGRSIAATSNTTTSSKNDTKKRTFEEIMLDTWDDGTKADISTFVSAVTKKNCNHKTSENGWTPLMILAGLSAKGIPSAIRHVRELGGDPAIVDSEGWNALHWAAFHGSIDGAKEFVKVPELLTVKDKEDKLPLDMARSEGNNEVAKLIREAMDELSAPDTETSEKDDGLRKRK